MGIGQGVRKLLNDLEKGRCAREKSGRLWCLLLVSLGSRSIFFSDSQTWAAYGDARIEDWDKIRYCHYNPQPIASFHRSFSRRCAMVEMTAHVETC